MPPNFGGKKVLPYRVVLAWLGCMMFAIPTFNWPFSIFFIKHLSV